MIVLGNTSINGNGGKPTRRRTMDCTAKVLLGVIAFSLLALNF